MAERDERRSRGPRRESGRARDRIQRAVGRRNGLEWAVLVVSALAIVAVVCVLLVDGLGETRPPDPAAELRIDEAREGTLGWIVPATLRNAGSEPAERVVLEATATVAGQEEASEVDVDFLPGGTEVDVSFAFSERPSSEVTVRVVSWVDP